MKGVKIFTQVPTNYTPSHMEVQMKRGTTSPPLHNSPLPGNILYKGKKLSILLGQDFRLVLKVLMSQTD